MQINILHLLWIVPLTSTFGLFAGALLNKGHIEDLEQENSFLKSRFDTQ